jgi:tetratricopeptide (TPR) repeat protein
MEKIMDRTALNRIILIVLVCIIFFACTSNEESARKLYNKALTLQQQGSGQEAIDIYRKIIAKYPETKIAVEVNKTLLARSEMQRITEEIHNESVRELLSTALDIFRLDNGRYPTTKEGLSVLIKNTSNIPRWDGPYLPELSHKHINDFNYTKTGQHNFQLTPK